MAELGGYLTPAYGAAGGIAEGLRAGLSSFQSARRDAQDIQQRALEQQMQKKAWQLKLAEAGLEENPDAVASGGDPFRMSKFGMEQKMRVAQLQNYQKASDTLNEVNKERAGKELPLLGASYLQNFMPRSAEDIRGLMQGGGTAPSAAPTAAGLLPPGPAGAAPNPATIARGGNPSDMTVLPGGPSLDRQAKLAALAKEQNDVVKQRRELSDPFNQAGALGQTQAKEHIDAIGKAQHVAGSLKAVINSLNDPKTPENVKLDQATMALDLLRAKDGAGNLRGESLTEAKRLLDPLRLTPPNMGFGRRYSDQANIFQAKLNEINNEIAERQEAVKGLVPGYKFPQQGMMARTEGGSDKLAGGDLHTPGWNGAKAARLKFLQDKTSGKGALAGGE